MKLDDQPPAATGTAQLAGRRRIDCGSRNVNVASTPAKRAWPNASACHAGKWGLLGLSHALHAELRPLGMRAPFLLDRFPDLDPALLPRDSVIAELTVLPMRETS